MRLLVLWLTLASGAFAAPTATFTSTPTPTEIVVAPTATVTPYYVILNSSRIGQSLVPGVFTQGLTGEYAYDLGFDQCYIMVQNSTKAARDLLAKVSVKITKADWDVARAAFQSSIKTGELKAHNGLKEPAPVQK